MTQHYLPYELSQEADYDLENIFDYTADRFGVDQAVLYVSGFEDVFNHLSNNPKSGRLRNDIRKGLRSFVKESHVIFFRVLEDKIRIVRVLHASRDVIKFLPPQA